MNVNPNNLIQMIKNGQNPQQLMLSILQNQMSDTPMGQNLLSLAKNNDVANLEMIARNMCAAQGMDFDAEFANFKRMLGL